MKYLSFTIPVSSPDESDQWVAMLSSAGFHGFEEGLKNLKAFIREDELEDAVKQLPLGFDISKFEQQQIAEENWNAQWESSFSPIEIPYPNATNIFLRIRAAFHEALSIADHEIIITPKMSFGTGHHATTFLVAQQMSILDFEDKSVLDFGTGTGVLAILAKKLGAANVTAIDNDKWSIENARENFEANSITGIDLKMKENLTDLGFFDTILANINLHVIGENLKDIVHHLKPNGNVLFSGILLSDAAQILPMITSEGFTVLKTENKDGWMMIHASK